jgi:hypothetical protein
MSVSPLQAVDENITREISRFFQVIDADRDEMITEQEYIKGLGLVADVLKRTDHPQQPEPMKGHEHVERVRSALDAAKDLAMDGSDGSERPPELNVNHVLAAAQATEPEALAESLGFVLDVLCTTGSATTRDEVKGTESNWLTLLPAILLWCIVAPTNMIGRFNKTDSRGPSCDDLYHPDSVCAERPWRCVDRQADPFDELVARCYLEGVICTSCTDPLALGSADDTFALNETVALEPGCTELTVLGFSRWCNRPVRGGDPILLNLDTALVWVATVWGAHVIWLLACLCTKVGRDVFCNVALVKNARSPAVRYVRAPVLKPSFVLPSEHSFYSSARRTDTPGLLHT